MSRLGHLLRGVGALVLLLALVVGIPWALWHFVGWPLPHHVPSAGQVGRTLNQQGIPDQTLVDALALVVWITWAILVVSITAEVPAAFAGRRVTRLPLAGFFQPLTGRLLAAVIVAVFTIAPRPGHATSGGSLGGLATANGGHPVGAAIQNEMVLTETALADAVHGSGVQRDTTLPGPTEPLAAIAPEAPGVSAPSGAKLSATSPPSSRTYVVQRGDTLWAIAEEQLGDPLRWSEIYQLNEGRLQPDGTTLNDPHWIYPGWMLLLPPGPTPTPPSAAPASTPLPAQAPSALTAPAPSPQTTPTSPSSTPVPAAQTRTQTPAPSGSRGAQSATSGTTSGIMAQEPNLGDKVYRLPSGSVVAGSFAAGVLSALVAVRLRRRRHYRPQSPGPGRRFAPDPRPTALRDLLVAVRSSGHKDDEFTCDAGFEPAPMTAIPDDDALLYPDMVEVASCHDGVVRLGLCDWPGLTLGGAGAASTLRAWLAALFTRNGPYGAEVLAIGPSGDLLFPGLDLPSLHRVGSLEAALSRLETAIVDRTRQLDEAGVVDAIAHRRVWPEFPLPLLLIVTDLVPPSLVPRWRALVESATKLGLGALVLLPEHATSTPTDANPSIVVAEDGSPQQVSPPRLAEQLVGSRLFGLSSADGVDLLGPVASIHKDQEPDPAGNSGVVLDRELLENGVVDDGVLDARAVEIARHGDLSAVGSEGAPAVSWPATAKPDSESAPIRVELFGPARVEAWGEKVSSGLRASAYELLAWYALRPDGATAEAAIDDLWPDVSAKRGRERFWTALGNLRSRLHGPDQDGNEIITKSGGHYRADSSVLDVDLWRFEAALTDAARAGEPADLILALGRASAAYGGVFYPTADALWVEPVREDLHRRALDVHIRLAELHLDDNRIDAALGALERAIDLDPICEEAYRRLIALQIRVGRHDAAQRTWRLLQRHLDELDLEPEAETTDLVHDALALRAAPVNDQAHPRPRPR